MLVFYGSTILWVIAALIGTALGEGPMHVVIYAWVRFHRWCARWILGITVCIEGDTRRPISVRGQASGDV